MRSFRPLLVAMFLLALAAVPVAAAPRSAADVARAEHNRVMDYWTAERMASAQPRDFVRTPSGFQPAARPPSGGGAVTGAPWPNGQGAISRSEGKVYFSMGGGNWQCSGTPATDARTGHSIVLTAAHCAFDETEGEFATNWVFIPAWDAKPATFSTACNNNATVYGCWRATALVVDSGYATAGGFNDQATRHDFAFAVVAGGGFNTTTQLESVVTSFNVSTSSVSAGATVYAFGFPASGKYKGNDLTYCTGTVITDAFNNDDTFGVGCDMTGGSSGGGWMAPFTPSTGLGSLGGLNSYGYSGVKNMYGPDFNANTQAVYDRAKTTQSGNQIVNVAP